MSFILRGCLLLISISLAVEGQTIAQKKCNEYQAQSLARAILTPSTPTKPVGEFYGVQLPDRLLGDHQPHFGEFPHSVLLGWPKPNAPTQYELPCGGALISDRYVLTGAHCLRQEDPTIARLAEYSILTDDEDQVDVPVESVVVHPAYDPNTVYNDIALVKLAKPVTFSRLIQPACLWTDHNLNVSKVVGLGFGQYDLLEGDIPNLMMKVTLDVLDGRMCEDQYGSLEKFPRGIVDSQLCLGGNDRHADVCLADSGSPVQIRNEPGSPTYHVVALASTLLCDARESPSVYTRVASYVDWIEEIVWGAV